jgi:hypothetical protein
MMAAVLGDIELSLLFCGLNSHARSFEVKREGQDVEL